MSKTIKDSKEAKIEKSKNDRKKPKMEPYNRKKVGK